MNSDLVEESEQRARTRENGEVDGEGGMEAETVHQSCACAPCPSFDIHPRSRYLPILPTNTPTPTSRSS